MNSPLIRKETFPKRSFSIISQIGLKALNLATTYATVIDPRLPGATESLAQDLDALGVVVPGALQTRHESVAATAAQNARIRQGHTRVRAVRMMVRSAGALKEVQKAYGVGQEMSSAQLSDVTAALKQIVDRATSAPEEAAELGLGPIAMAELTGFLASLTEADKTQDTKRANAPLSTKERNLTANRILQTAALIAGAGMLAFADDPTTHGSFEALMTSLKRPRSKPASSDGTKKKSARPKATPNTPPAEGPSAEEAAASPDEQAGGAQPS